MDRLPLRLPFVDRLDPHMREVVRGASVTFMVKAVSGGLGFALNVAAARILGADGAGIFFLALSVATVTSVLARLGLENALLRFVAARATVRDWAGVRGVYHKSLLIALGGAVVFGGALFLTAGALAHAVFDKPALEEPLRVIALAVPPLVLVILNGQALQGLKQILLSQLTAGVAVPGLTLIGLLLVGDRYGVGGVAWAYVAATVCAAAASGGVWRVFTPALRGVDGSFPAGTLLRSARPLFVVSACQLVLEWGSVLLLGVWASAAEVAIFTVAYRTALLARLVLNSVNSIAAPKFAELYELGEMQALGSTVRNSTRMMLVLAAPVLLGLALVPGFVMSLFGPEFVTGAAVLVILAIGQFVNVGTGSVGWLLIMTGNEQIARTNVAVAAGLDILLNVLLIPPYGAVGAALATAVSIAVLNLSGAYLAWRRLGIMTLPLTWRE